MPDRADPAQAAYVMFTSGSTGEPKAILGSHAGLDHFIAWEQRELAAAATFRVANLAPTTFDVSLRDIFLPLVAGGTVCIPAPEIRMNAAALLAWLEAQRITVLHVVPSVFRQLLKEMETAGGRHLASLRYILFAGEPLYGRDVAKTRALIGDAADLINLYGPSETSLAKFCLRIPRAATEPARMLPVGRPIDGTRVFLIRDNRAVAAGAIGEICIEPPFRPLGYLGMPDMTAAAFTGNPIDPAGGVIYRTGDMGRLLADGDLEFIGRRDRQVKINGVRLELGEVEHAVGSHPDIEQAVVEALKGSDGESVLAAYFTEKRPVDVEALRQRLQSALPPAMLPAFFVRLDAFPLNMNGKIDRQALPKPEALIYDRIRYEPPSGEIETRLAAIWAEALGLERRRRSVALLRSRRQLAARGAHRGPHQSRIRLVDHDPELL